MGRKKKTERKKLLTASFGTKVKNWYKRQYPEDTKNAERMGNIDFATLLFYFPYECIFNERTGLGGVSETAVKRVLEKLCEILKLKYDPFVAENTAVENLWKKYQTTHGHTLKKLEEERLKLLDNLAREINKIKQQIRHIEIIRDIQKNGRLGFDTSGGKFQVSKTITESFETYDEALTFATGKYCESAERVEIRSTDEANPVIKVIKDPDKGAYNYIEYTGADEMGQNLIKEFYREHPIRPEDPRITHRSIDLRTWIEWANNQFLSKY